MLAREAARHLADRKGVDVVLLDVSRDSSVTDYFVIATGRSDVHVRALCESVEEGLRANGTRPLSSEGRANGQWALLDYGEVVVHVFQAMTRRFYDLERLWNQAPKEAYTERARAAGSRH